MLQKIEISNFALIDNLSLDFSTGYSVITGETGAGKSILLKAINLLIGGRADYSVIRDKERKCILEAEFDIEKLNLNSFFETNDIDYENITVVRREFTPNGKSRIFINDTPVNLNTLKEFGGFIIKIHTQHETLDLFDRDFQLNTIDTFAGQNDVVTDYEFLFKQYKSGLVKLERLKSEEAENRKEQDLFWFEKSIELGLIELIESNELIAKEKKKLLEKIKNSEVDSFYASDEILKIVKDKYSGI